jgi:hypothetical protein
VAVADAVVVVVVVIDGDDDYGYEYDHDHDHDHERDHAHELSGISSQTLSRVACGVSTDTPRRRSFRAARICNHLRGLATAWK